MLILNGVYFDRNNTQFWHCHRYRNACIKTDNMILLFFIEALT